MWMLSYTRVRNSQNMGQYWRTAPNLTLITALVHLYVVRYFPLIVLALSRFIKGSIKHVYGGKPHANNSIRNQQSQEHFISTLLFICDLFGVDL